MDLDFNVMFSDPYSRYTGPTDRSGFNQTGGHEF